MNTFKWILTVQFGKKAKPCTPRFPEGWRSINVGMFTLLWRFEREGG